MTPLIGTCILSEIFSNNTTANTEQVFNQNFEKIFSSLMVRISSSLSNQMPIPKAKDDSASETSANSTSTHKKDDNKNSTKALIQAEYKKLDPCKIAIGIIFINWLIYLLIRTKQKIQSIFWNFGFRNETNILVSLQTVFFP
jgi:hypothetical protein